MPRLPPPFEKIEFLRVAQTTGLATSLSRSLLAQFPDDFAALSADSDADVRISLGALRDHLLHDDFVADIHAFLERGAVPPERLELRIAEKVFLARHSADFRSLQRLGVRFVVDEVGRDAGSLASLARGPVCRNVSGEVRRARADRRLRARHEQPPAGLARARGAAAPGGP